MRFSNRLIIVFAFVMFEIIYLMSILATGGVPMFILENMAGFIMLVVAFNVILLTALIF